MLFGKKKENDIFDFGSLGKWSEETLKAQVGYGGTVNAIETLYNKIRTEEFDKIDGNGSFYYRFLACKRLEELKDEYSKYQNALDLIRKHLYDLW